MEPLNDTRLKILAPDYTISLAVLWYAYRELVDAGFQEAAEYLQTKTIPELQKKEKQ
jgi:hypothetical protein